MMMSSRNRILIVSLAAIWAEVTHSAKPEASVERYGRAIQRIRIPGS